MKVEPTILQIINAVNDFVGFKVDFTTRKREHCEPKQIMQYLIREILMVDHRQIAKYFNCDRSNIYNGVKKVSTLIKDKDKQIQYRTLFDQFDIDIMDYGFDIKQKS